MKKEYASNVRLSQLTLVDGPPTTGEVPADTGPPTSTGAKAASGATTASTDRAASLSVTNREPGSERAAQRVPPSRAVAGAKVDARGESDATERRRDGVTWLNRKQAMAIAGALGFLLLVAALIVMRSRSDAPLQPNPTQPVSSVANPSPPSSSTSTRVADTATPGTAAPNEDYAGRVQALKSAGNWNMLVIYAAEWTRKQPTNPEAWRELSAGYLKLRQFRDALDAATQAVQVAPEGFLGWQNLGLVNVTLQQSAEALVAFDRAVALNDKDVVSLVQTGMLNTQLGRYPDARVAFAKALVASPENVDALCGATAVAQREGRLQDAQEMTGQVRSLNGSCPDPNAAQSVRVVASQARNSKGELPARR
jgi:Flp pilus assembly protein TadD